MQARGSAKRRLGFTGWAVLAALALVAFVACESDGGGGSDAGGDVAETPAGTGPAAACGGLQAGDFVAGGGGSEGDDTLKLSVGTGERPLDVVVRLGSDIVMLAFVNSFAEPGQRPVWGEDRQTVVIGPINAVTADAAVSGAVFDDVNEGFGGSIVEGRFCFDSAPATGQPLAGSWVFVLAVGAQQDLYRVQGTFSAPGDAVTADGDTLVVAAQTGATVTLE